MRGKCQQYNFIGFNLLNWLQKVIRKSNEKGDYAKEIKFYFSGLVFLWNWKCFIQVRMFH